MSGPGDDPIPTGDRGDAGAPDELDAYARESDAHGPSAQGPDAHGPDAQSVAPPLRGQSGPLDAADLLRTLLELGATGTLAVANPASPGLCATLIEAGESLARQKLGAVPADDATDVPFLFHPHELPSGPLHGVPELPAALPAATTPALLTVPQVPGGTIVPAALATLAQASEHATRIRFGGALVVGGEDPGPCAVAWWFDGRLVAAIGERDGREVRRSDAMRLLARLTADPGGPDARWLPLAPELIRAGVGTAMDRRQDAPNGVRVGTTGTTLLQGGVPLLRTVHPHAERQGRFAAHDDPSRLPALPLPEDPPDWETRTYLLTLRGRDALDPMTELAMRFDREVGPSGKKILLAVRRGLTVQATADELGLDLDQLGAWLRRLEAEGMVRGRA